MVRQLISGIQLALIAKKSGSHNVIQKIVFFQKYAVLEVYSATMPNN